MSYDKEMQRKLAEEAEKVWEYAKKLSESHATDEPVEYVGQVNPAAPKGYGFAQKSSDDPWAHRASGMRCRTCLWYVVKQRGPAPLLAREIGRCRRHAPTMNGYPVVFNDDWCGDHKLDENKA